MCAHKGPGTHGTLACTRLTPHDEAGELGHVYDGDSVPDGHTLSEDAAEVSRG